MEKKQAAASFGLFKDIPKEFETYFERVSALRPDEKADYAYLRRMFGKLFRSSGFQYDYVFDWTELKFMEHLEKLKEGG